MLSTQTHGQRCRGLKGSCRQKEEKEEEEEGREGPALPLRTAAAHCSRRKQRVPDPAWLLRLSQGYCPPQAVGTARCGSLSPRCWQVQGLSPSGLCSTPGVWPVLPSAHHSCKHNGSCLPVEGL